MTRLATLLDLYATSQTFSWSDIELEELPTYSARITQVGRFADILPDLRAGVMGEKSVQLTVSNASSETISYYGVTAAGHENGYGDEAGYGGLGDPSISEVMTQQDLRGIKARVRIWDIDAAATQFTIEGLLSEVGLKPHDAVLRVETHDKAAFQEPVPKELIIEKFASADITGSGNAEAPIIVPFGIMRKVPLAFVASVADTSYDFGAFRKPAAGSLAVNTIYRNGAVVDSGEYTLTESVTGYYVVRFTLDQRDRGRLAAIQADVTVTEFVSPANAIKFVVNDSTHGLGLDVNAASFATAVTSYTTLGIAVTGGMDTRRPAVDVLNDLLVHGARLDRNNSGEVTIQVDTLALHATQSLRLGVGDSAQENIVLDSVEMRTPRHGDQIKSLRLFGDYDPGLQGASADPAQWLLNSYSSASVKGTALELHNPYLGDSGDTASLDRQRHYLWKRLRASQHELEFEAELEAEDLSVDELLTISIPTMVLNGVTREVRELGYHTSRTGSDIEAGVDVKAIQWDADIFTFAAGTLTTLPGAATKTDYLFTRPTTPSSFTVDSSTVRQPTTGDGIVETIITMTANAPSNDNLTHLVFQALRDGSTVVHNEVAIEATNGQTNRTAELSLEPGLRYDLQCITRNIGNAPAYTDSTAATVSNHDAATDSVRPATPTGLAILATEGAISLDWNDNSESDFSEYQVWRDTNADFSADALIAETKASRFEDFGTAAAPLVDGTTYHYRIIAKDRTENPSTATNALRDAVATSGVSGAFVPAVSDHTPATPDPPIVTGAGDATYTASDGRTLAVVQITFPALSTNAVGLHLLMKTASGDYRIVAEDLSGGTTVLVDDLTPGVSYTFAARAYPAAGTPSALSTTVTDVAPGDLTFPGVVTSTGMTQHGHAKTVTLKFTNLDDATVKEYIIYGESASSTTEIGRVAGGRGGGANSFTFNSTIAYGSAVAMRVQAVDYSGQKSSSNPASYVAAFSADQTVTLERTRTDDITDTEVTDPKRSNLSTTSISISARAAADGTTGHPSNTNPSFSNPELREIMVHLEHDGLAGQILTLRSVSNNLVFSAQNWVASTWTPSGTVHYW